MTPAQIWWGKFIAALLFLVLLLVNALPILSLPIALGGVGPREVAIAAGITLLVLASMSSVGLYCSSFFRRSVHATAVSYAIVVALTVLTAVSFSILESRWETSQAASQVTVEPPGYVRATLYLNPFFPLLAIFAEAEQRHFRDWATSLGKPASRRLVRAPGVVQTALRPTGAAKRRFCPPWKCSMESSSTRFGSSRLRLGALTCVQQTFAR